VYTSVPVITARVAGFTSTAIVFNFRTTLSYRRCGAACGQRLSC